MKFFILLIAVLLTVFSIPYVFGFLLFFAWSTIYPILSWLVLAFVLLLYIYIWNNILVYVKQKKLMKKKKQIIYLSLFLIVGICMGSIHMYDAYQNRFNKVSSEVDLSQYMPFHSNKLAQLDEQATLSLTNPLPVLDGATALYPLYSAMTQAIYPKDDYSPYNSEVLCSKTPDAYLNLLHEGADIIFVAGPSKQQEEAFSEKGLELIKTPIGKESFVFFVHGDNPVNSLTIQQLQGIYSGVITNWKEVGGEDEDIKAFQRPDGSGSQSALLRLMNEIPVMTPPKEDVIAGMGGIISETAEYENRKNAIGYSFRFFTEEMVKNKEIKLLEIEGIAPTIDTIRNETYPIVSDFYAIHLQSNEKESVLQIINWLVSSQGKELIEKSGYVAT